MPEADGLPDGLTVDSEGCVWSAQWGGWRLTRYDPDGKVERVVKLPVPNPTSCVFGGPDLTDLYVTSAWLLLSEAERQAAPGQATSSSSTPISRACPSRSSPGEHEPRKFSQHAP